MQKSISILGLLVLFSFSANSQIEVSEILQKSKIVETESNKLYFVDFWATWCGPCVYSKKLLTVLQQQYPRDFHAISISEENPAKVERFIKKNPTLLTVAVDNEGKTFSDYGVKSLPQGILFNAKGEKLWEGHPSDLKPGLLSRFLRENKTRKPFNAFVEVIQHSSDVTKDYQPQKDMEIKISSSSIEDLETSMLSTHLRLQGSLTNILSHLSKINKKQIRISANLDKIYTLYIEKSKLNTPDLNLEILHFLGLSVNENSKLGEAIILKVNSPKFWDTNQIDWGNNDTKYLIGDSDISADNINFKEMSYQLSQALELPVILDVKDDKYLYSLHDWQVHYKFFELMQNNLEEYGIEIKKEITNYPQYQIIKKAP